ncbi:MAG: Fe-Mn family superoxide dismutase [Candidatus Pacebacteria bacterium]|nr:Fe-Mn family superoxide dismutase [Candidatus Paceibacterota bacterium]
MIYTPKQFAFGTLQGISQKQLDVHIKLYEGYVKFINVIEEQQKELLKDSEKNAYALAEVTRRIGFEWNGMRMHEHYFAQWEGAASPIAGPLADALAAQYGSIEAWHARFKGVAMMRGIGWAILSWDPVGKQFVNHFVADHELGQLNGLTTVLALDMWEHAFMVDYVPAEKAQYVDAFFANLNGSVVAQRFTAA